MNTLMVIKHIKTRIVEKQYFNSEDEAINWWSSLPIADEWEIIYLKERKPSGHRYVLKYTKPDERGILYSKYIICFSKKEAVFLQQKIRKENPNYITNIKKIY